MATEHHLTVQRTARYYTLGQLNADTKRVWFCLHGFGQLASFFSRKFTGLDDGQTLVVAPEGLSRLYLNGGYERVGASWMTREDRQHEIDDYISYLNTLYDHLLADAALADLHITLLGFSQGAATACRWLNAGSVQAHRLILWAGFFPNGVRELLDPARLATIETHYVYGRQDEYIAELDDIEGYLRRIQTDVPGLKLTAYEGGHRVEPDVLQSL
ncbi:phospholipase [Fibrisoma montanum]|uniref:Phospholipase n=1 Tax=Fibrisoma montanum TaxID=2305895 RepID=A0A418LX13_9BACT|nr:phospholipase [Fibrisoma montanum]RIV17793.1 phospholipase [Fibrisoma montanum]